ncbi:MAG: hypothetical protein ABEH90_08955 [Halolamina sp.]
MKPEGPEFDVRDSGLPTDVLATDDSVLVRGPALSGKYGLLLDLLAAYSEHAVLVSTSRQAAGARTDFAAYGDPDRLAVVDATTRVQDGDGEDPLLRYASSPRNLTAIGVKFTGLVELLREREPETVAVGVHSLSELLMYRDVERVFQFVRVMLGECRDLDWPMVATIDDTAVAEPAVSTLAQPFDAVIETRIADDGSQAFTVQREDTG